MNARSFACLFVCAAVISFGEAVSITIPSTVLALTATPQTMMVSQGGTLYLNCTYNPPVDTHELASIVRMILSRMAGTDPTGKPIYNEIAGLNEYINYTTSYGHPNEAMYGSIKKVTEVSHIGLVITNPVQDQLTTYRCDINIMSIWGQAETLHKETTVSTGNRTCTAADLYAAEDQLDCTQQAFFDYVSNGAGVIGLRRLLVNNNIFQESGFYGNPIHPIRYFLLNINAHPSADDAVGACAAIGGYLAEIDDIYELDFITSFTQPYQVPNAPNHIDSLYLGARDDRVEGQWYYQYSGKPMPVLNRWGPGEPNGGRAENCLALSYHQASGQSVLGDYPCNATGTVVTSFLCEIPDLFMIHYSYTTNQGVTCSYP